MRDAEVCAATENGDLTPYSTEYEGYMGNWGNTLDRWYHRAAIVVWPRSQAFANRAETSPSWALDELTTIAAADHNSALASARTLGPFWEGSVRGLSSRETGPVGTPLAAARVVQYDSKTKTLSPNGGGSLTQFPGNQPGEAAYVPSWQDFNSDLTVGVQRLDPPLALE